MPELKPHFQTDPKDKIDNSAEQYDDIENSDYDSISVTKITTYNDDEYDY